MHRSWVLQYKRKSAKGEEMLQCKDPGSLHTSCVILANLGLTCLGIMCQITHNSAYLGALLQKVNEIAFKVFSPQKYKT